MKYVPMYKCRLCGTNIQVARGLKASKDEVVEVINKIQYMNSKGLTTWLDNYPDPQLIHHCKNGSIGIADFSGFRYEEY